MKNRKATRARRSGGLTGLLLEALPLGRPTRIVDVGANGVNVPPYAALLRAGGCHVIGFEPDPGAFEALVRAKGTHETYFPHAVGDGRRAELRIIRPSGFTSLFEPDRAALAVLGRKRWGNVVDRQELETVSLDSVADLGEVDLLKIDIQGGERDVFVGAKRVLAGAVAVITEVRYFPIYESEPMLGGVDEELRRQGFLLHRFLTPKTIPLPSSQAARLRQSQVADQVIDGDAIYIRDLRCIADFTDEMLAHLALLAGTVFGSHSLSLLCIDALAGRGAVSDDLASRYVDLLPDDLRAEAAPVDGGAAR